MILFPNCKINLGLNIIRKRDDGYHDIETIFYPVGLKDALEGIRIETTTSSSQDGIEFESSGLTIAGNTGDNLCVKAYALLKKDFPGLNAVKLHLHKVIPMGAGLGGGSADGAFTLLLLDKLLNLHLSQEQLLGYALQLGSDCPFFILNTPCFAGGRGELMQPVSPDLSKYRFVIVNPGIHVSTAQAFAQVKPSQPKNSIREIIQRPVEEWKGLLINDFEKPVCDMHPQIATIVNELYANGAVYAAMTGSGSSVFGLFYKDETPSFSFQSTCKVYYI